MTDPQLSEVIKGYEAALLPLALRLAGRDGAEVDDLMQEGFISIWSALENGVTPSMGIAFKRMLAWIRYIRPHTPCAYTDMLELDPSYA